MAVTAAVTVTVVVCVTVDRESEDRIICSPLTRSDICHSADRHISRHCIMQRRASGTIVD